MSEIDRLVELAHANSRAKGFWDDQNPFDVTVALAKLALIHSEASEATEEIRVGNDEAIAEELADICIRVFDLAGARGITLSTAIKEKMAKNAARPRMHGKLA